MTKSNRAWYVHTDEKFETHFGTLESGHIVTACKQTLKPMKSPDGKPIIRTLPDEKKKFCPACWEVWLL